MAALIIGGIATTLCIQHQAQARLHEQNELLRQQATQLARLQSEHDQLLNLAGKTADPRTEAQDLARLRVESESLRNQTNVLTQWESENRRLRILARNSQTLLEQQEEAKVMGISRMKYSLRWALAFILYADKHNDEFPGSFEEAAPYFRDRTAEDDRLFDEFEIVYAGHSYAAITNAVATIVIREKEPRQGPNGKWSKAYGFADGHSEIHSKPPEGFEAYEKQHSFPVRNTE